MPEKLDSVYVPFDVETFKELWGRLIAVETSNKLLHDEIVFLSEHVQKLEERKAEIRELKESTQLAKDNLDGRLESMNEFRAQIRDQTATFLPRAEYLNQHTALEQRIMRADEDIRGLRESRAELLGKASQNSVFLAYAIAVVGIILSIVAVLR